MRKNCALLAFFVACNLYAETTVDLGKSQIPLGDSYQGSILGAERKNALVIRSEDLEKKNYQKLLDVFEDSPYCVVTHTAAGPLVALRGSGEKTLMRVKILLDGIPLTSLDDVMGVIPFEAIPLHSIAKIEIVPGGGIALYGPGAASGVINIVTKAGKKDFGQVNLGLASFSERNLSLEKGLSLGEKAFLQVAVDGKKGLSYREGDALEALHLRGSFDYTFTPKLQARLEWNRFQGEEDQSSAISLWELKRDRRQEGEFLSHTKSKRDAFAFHAKFQPTKKLDFHLSMDQSHFKRDLSQDATPFVNYLPGGMFVQDFVLKMKSDLRYDPILKNCQTILRGDILEKSRGFDLKADYKHERGKCILGYTKREDELKRSIHHKMGPYKEQDAYIFIRNKDAKLFSADRLKSTEEGEMLPFFDAMDISRFFNFPSYFKDVNTPVATDKYGRPLVYNGGFTKAETVLYDKFEVEELNYRIFQNLDRKYHFDEALKAAYEKDMEKVRELQKAGDEAGLVALQKGKAYWSPSYLNLGDYYRWLIHEAYEDHREEWDKVMLLQMGLMSQQVREIAKLPMKKLLKDVAYADKDKNIIRIRTEDILGYKYYKNRDDMDAGENEVDVSQLTEEEIYNRVKYKKAYWKGKGGKRAWRKQRLYKESIPRMAEIVIDEKTTFYDVLKEVYKDKNPSLVSSSITNTKIDVKKDAEAFYLHNSFDLTKNFTLNAGLRYEQTRYKGERRSESVALLEKTGDLTKPIDDTEIKRVLNRYLELSKLYKMDTGKNISGRGNKKNDFKKIMEDSIAKFDKDYHLELPLTSLRSDISRREDNIGGNLGFEYRLGEQTLYANYERGFTTPLPTQLTNKTFDPVNRVKTYWESHVKTEKNHNVEIGLRGNIGDFTSYACTAFLNDSYDEIVSMVKNGNSHMNREWRFLNLEKTRRMGIELQAAQELGKWELKESLSYVLPKILSNDYQSELRSIVDEQKKSLIQNHRFYDKDYLKLREAPVEEGLAILKEVYQDPAYQEEIARYREEVPTNKSFEAYKKKFFAENQYFQSLSPEKQEALRLPLEQMLDSDASYAEAVGRHLEKVDYETCMQSGNYFKKGDRIPLAPKVKASFALDYHYNENLSLGTNLTYVGNYYTAEPSYGYEIVKTKVPGHFLTDVYGSYHFTPETSLKIGINNVFNHEYNQRQDSDTALPAPGRTYSLGITHKF